MKWNLTRSAPQPDVRHELIKLLYTSLPQVASIGLCATVGAVCLTIVRGDAVYAVLSVLLLITSVARLWTLFRYSRLAAEMSEADAVRWEYVYGVGASIFGAELGALSARAIWLGDATGSWLAYGLCMAYCVGLVSRAAVRPWIVQLVAAVMFTPTFVAGALRPELAYQAGAWMLLLFWVSLRETSLHLSSAFVQRIEAQKLLAKQASHDFLTGLLNRAGFLAALDSTGEQVAIIALDLDGFKQVNDSLGHFAGDQLLRQVAERLRDCIGPHGLAARFGGDEFMLLYSVAPGRKGEETASIIAERAIRALSLPFFISDEQVSIGASAGILVTDGNHDLPMPELLKQADEALYAAKRAGGGRWQWFGEPTAIQKAG